MLVEAVTPTSMTWIWLAAAVVIVVILAVVALRQRRSQSLRQRFGPEYQRTVAATGSTQRAEAELERREKRHRALDIRPLMPGARKRYTETWRDVQARFVDDPGGAVGDADRLLTDVMRDRGYPTDISVERRMDDLSVDHASVLNNYRVATEIAQRSATGQASTEDLRQAMVSYRMLFAGLVGADPVTATVEGRIVEPNRREASRGTRT